MKPQIGSNVFSYFQDLNSLSARALSFIEIGIACNAITVIEKAGIFNKIIDLGYFEESKLKKQSLKKQILLKSSLKTLTHVGVLSKKKGQYSMTDLGSELWESMPIIKMLFVGYGKLFSRQTDILSKEDFSYADLNNEAISEASKNLPLYDLEEELHEIIVKLSPSGVICDLGCGSGHRLMKLHELTGMRCLGIDLGKESIDLAKAKTSDNPFINFFQGDVTKLEEKWKEVEILMQCFMTHDISPNEFCVKTLKSYKDKFTNMRYFLVLDTFSSNTASNQDTIAPGFDYIHGLQGIPTRTYEETISLYTRAGFSIEREFKSSIFPNTCLWLLKPS